MKSIKQILAILGIVLILGLNVLLVFAAGTASEDGMGMFGGAVVAVVILSVFKLFNSVYYRFIET